MENNNQQFNEKFKSILEKINKNEIKIKPKTYFRLKFAALIIVLTALIVVAVFFTSLILFTIRASGHASLIGFGLNGFEVFILLFPWKLLIVGIVLVVILEWLLRSFRFAYKVPVLYLLLGLMIFTSLLGVTLDYFHVHDEFIRRAGIEKLPLPIGRVYDQARRAPPPPKGHGIHRGIITAVGTSTVHVVIDDPRTASTTLVSIYLPPMFATSSIQVGDTMFIRGEIIDGMITAQNIKKVMK